MDIEQFSAYAGTYGGSIARWPQQSQDSAYALLAQSAPAQHLLAEASTLDGCLGSAAMPTVPAELRARILALPQQAPRGMVVWAWRPYNKPALALVACVIFGLLSGVASAPMRAPDDASAWIIAPDHSVEN